MEMSEISQRGLFIFCLAQFPYFGLIETIITVRVHFSDMD